MNSDVGKFIDTIRELSTQFENELHLHEGFMSELLQEDDWSFVIKTHALVEAAISHQLASALDERLLPVFRNLELSNKKVGKIMFVEALGLLEKGSKTFVHKLSELRNILAHDIRNVDFSFANHVKSLDNNQRNSFHEAIVAFSTPESKNQWLKNARDNPKIAIWLSTIRIVVFSSITSMKAKLEKQFMSLSAERIRIQEDEQHSGKGE